MAFKIEALREVRGGGLRWDFVK